MPNVFASRIHAREQVEQAAQARAEQWDNDPENPGRGRQTFRELVQQLRHVYAEDVTDDVRHVELLRWADRFRQALTADRQPGCRFLQRAVAACLEEAKIEENGPGRDPRYGWKPYLLACQFLPPESVVGRAVRRAAHTSEVWQTSEV